jgi:hypothetical protein
MNTWKNNINPAPMCRIFFIQIFLNIIDNKINNIYYKNQINNIYFPKKDGVHHALKNHNK